MQIVLLIKFSTRSTRNFRFGLLSRTSYASSNFDTTDLPLQNPFTSRGAVFSKVASMELFWVLHFPVDG